MSSLVTRSMALLAIVAGMALAGCGSDEPAVPDASELVGTIVDVDDPGGEITAFTLQSEGESYEISIADDVDYGFDLRHLKEHQATRDPVRCALETRGDRAYALSIEDA